MHESIVYGVIRDVAFGDGQDCLRRHEHNRQIIEALPGPEGCPFISRDMLGVCNSDEIGSASQTQIIHFGASYRGVEYEWELWLEKFESILRQMYWVHAKVHLETECAGHHVFVWEPVQEYHEPHSPLSVRCEWEHEGLNYFQR